MRELGDFAAGGAVLAVGVGGLFVAAYGEDRASYAAGLAVFALSIVFVFWLIKRRFDDA